MIDIYSKIHHDGSFLILYSSEMLLIKSKCFQRVLVIFKKLKQYIKLMPSLALDELAV